MYPRMGNQPWAADRNLFHYRVPHKHSMVTLLRIRPVRAAVPRLNENCISGFPESV